MTTNQTRTTCPQCGEPFSTRAAMERHLFSQPIGHQQATVTTTTNQTGEHEHCWHGGQAQPCCDYCCRCAGERCPSGICQWCVQGDVPKLLDEDGTLISITGKRGTLCHAHEEYWWPCLQYGAKLQTARGMPPTQPAPDAGGEWRVTLDSGNDDDDAVIRDNRGNQWIGRVKRKYAAQIVADHAAVPKLVDALIKARNDAQVFTGAQHLDTALQGLREIVREIDLALAVRR